MSLRVYPTFNEAQWKKLILLAKTQGLTPNALAKRLCIVYIQSPEEMEKVIGEILEKNTNFKKTINHYEESESF